MEVFNFFLVKFDILVKFEVKDSLLNSICKNVE